MEYSDAMVASADVFLARPTQLSRHAKMNPRGRECLDAYVWAFSPAQLPF
jgi:hypothetical protein